MKGPLLPFKDAAPLAGRAGVNDSNSHPDRTSACAHMKPPSHHHAPAGTSSVAAARIGPQVRTQRERVRAFIASRGPEGATDDEGEAALAMRPQSYTPRRRELVKLGLVVDSGRRRATASGRPAAVWVAARHAQSGRDWGRRD